MHAQTIHELVHCDLKATAPQDRATDLIGTTLATAILTEQEWRFVMLAVKLLNGVLTATKTCVIHLSLRVALCTHPVTLAVRSPSELLLNLSTLYTCTCKHGSLSVYMQLA